MISFNFYQTHGEGCEKFRFIRVGPRRWKRVLKWWIFYVPVGPVMYEHPCNYYPEGRPDVMPDFSGGV